MDKVAPMSTLYKVLVRNSHWKRNWRELIFGSGVILLTFGEALVYYGSARFRAPIEPLLVLLAAGGLWWIVQVTANPLRRLRKRWQKAAPVVVPDLQPIEQH